MTRKNNISTAVLVLALMASQGCGTIVHHTHVRRGPPFYRGTIAEIKLLTEPSDPLPGLDFRWCAELGAMFDLPFSVVADTAMVPVDAVLLLCRDEKRDGHAGSAGKSLGKSSKSVRDTGGNSPPR